MDNCFTFQDLWAHTDNGTAVRNFTASSVPAHGVVALLLRDVGDEPDGTSESHVSVVRCSSCLRDFPSVCRMDRLCGPERDFCGWLRTLNLHRPTVCSSVRVDTPTVVLVAERVFLCTVLHLHYSNTLKIRPLL